ncbi:hypothetical protein CDL12_12858 [Handroanthus impetiginosus]|uniref:DUF4408 domain-containing protein n=1 Tax=Handroanthus impetiginosus TaxID=429701 RepID=A0A2G9HAI8_9LAMI|nr:hypothetical protein CDL12_12858 [Handroanthus impetiginosus]
MAAEKMKKDQLQPIWFAAGTAALMACIERAVVVSLFTHWRVWAFLALNLLLLAILFTSKSQIEIDKEGDDCSELDRKKMRQKHRDESKIETKKEKATEEHDQSDSVTRGNESVKVEFMNEEDDRKSEMHEEISKEELNQRVEAFIAMFRQHLVYDAKGKSFGQVNSTRRASFSYGNEYIRTRRKA